MSRQIHKLSAKQVDSLSEPGRYGDGGNLSLRVKDGSKTWSFTYQVDGKHYDLGLGTAGKKGSVSLAEARKKAQLYREQLAQGLNPKHVRDAHKAASKALAASEADKSTFGEWAKRYVDTHEESWVNAKHRQQWRNTLANDAAAISEMKIDDIDVQDVLDVLRPIWTRKPETARRLRGRIERVFDAAIAAGDRLPPNPALWKGNLQPLLPEIRKKALIQHYRSLHYKELPEFIRSLRAREALSASALEFLILTASRTGEVVGANWFEVDMETKTWTIPASRMKARKAHEVPLSTRAIEILEETQPLANGDQSKPIFPNRRGSRLSNMAMLTLLDRMEYRGQTTVPLAHQNPDRVEAAYQRSTLLPKRQEMMEEWSSYLSGPQHGL